jgi:hypothetical protein
MSEWFGVGLARRAPIGDEGGMDQNQLPDPEPPAPRGNRGNVVALVVVLALVLIGWVLTQKLHQTSDLQDCVASGRTNCAPIAPDR